MNSSGKDRVEDGDEQGWLNLSLGSNGLESATTSMIKVYTCSFCKRKFHNSQALGGHQNAHRRERDAARKYPAFHFHQSMEVHSSCLLQLVTPPGRGDGSETTTSTVARFINHGYGVTSVQNQRERSLEDFKSNTLDLNLKL
ncbi:zinc finger protein 11-like [Cynara cardunculus var. scolymus]|uniref:Zinc finger, C2H2 n=1 Tax=Cynara cardunculus var. scolymus TaxID=59895 RepID=A0A103YKF5_CYNCS|nr:zinc finger protein 11-like [Cynara cardunculus var. scolymus]KVI10804.1 Zinc finger, C2H2 [Cynara cardunculus var. scolymus]